MQVLNENQIVAVAGGIICGPDSSLRCPIAEPQSEFGRMVDDVAGALNDFGSWLGGAIYDATH